MFRQSWNQHSLLERSARPSQTDFKTLERHAITSILSNYLSMFQPSKQPTSHLVSQCNSLIPLISRAKSWSRVRLGCTPFVRQKVKTLPWPSEKGTCFRLDHCQQSARLVKRRRTLLESNSPRNNQPETHQDDERGRGRRVAPSAFCAHRIDRFPYASKNSPGPTSGAVEKIDCRSNTRAVFGPLASKINFLHAWTTTSSVGNSSCWRSNSAGGK